MRLSSAAPPSGRDLSSALLSLVRLGVGDDVIATESAAAPNGINGANPLVAKGSDSNERDAERQKMRPPTVLAAAVAAGVLPEARLRGVEPLPGRGPQPNQLGCRRRKLERIEHPRA